MNQKMGEISACLLGLAMFGILPSIRAQEAPGPLIFAALRPDRNPGREFGLSCPCGKRAGPWVESLLA